MVRIVESKSLVRVTARLMFVLNVERGVCFLVLYSSISTVECFGDLKHGTENSTASVIGGSCIALDRCVYHRGVAVQETSQNGGGIEMSSISGRVSGMCGVSTSIYAGDQ